MPQYARIVHFLLTFRHVAVLPRFILGTKRYGNLNFMRDRWKPTTDAVFPLFVLGVSGFGTYIINIFVADEEEGIQKRHTELESISIFQKLLISAFLR